MLIQSQQREEELQAKILLQAEMSTNHDEGEYNEGDDTKEFGKLEIF